MTAAVATALWVVFIIFLISWIANYDEEPCSDEEAEQIKHWLDNSESH